MRRSDFIIPALLCMFLAPLSGQEKTLKREVTLYNPYKPSLNEARKRSFLPDMTDTASFRPQFGYEVNTTPFMPEYSVSPVRAAVLQPDPLDKLYKSYVNLGLGNNTSTLGEVSITNERSKKGAIGFYGRHYSNNGKVGLANGQKAFAGYMDNDASVFGKRFFRNNVLGASADVIQKTRHAYGYDTTFTDYFPGKKNTRISYANLGAKLALSSLNLDSSSFSYDFDFHYNYFINTRDLYHHNFGFGGYMAKVFKGFYAGAGLAYENYKLPLHVLQHSRYTASLSPFVKKSTEQWNFKLGFQALLDRNIVQEAKLHLYPDLEFGFSIVPSYIRFYTALSGKLESNDPLRIIDENPFLVTDGSLLTLPNTSHQLVFTAGLKGNNGIGGNYLLAAKYSLISDMLFYSNIVIKDTIFMPFRGNLFAPLTDDVDILNIHGEITASITDKLSFLGSADFNKYTMTEFSYAWNRPDWEVSGGLKYNLRNKIIAGMQVTTLGPRKAVVNGNIGPGETELQPVIFDLPYHVNMDISAEYRYSKILSFWTKFNNISYQKYYEWAYYPSQRFLFMLGFTYSL